MGKLHGAFVTLYTVYLQIGAAPQSSTECRNIYKWNGIEELPIKHFDSITF